ncbi:hypothetical protein DOTSEDRAFT_22715 [Dothistroma septosporum NZE10]|uniref:Uncharacterized protein n=1 Tax=Dothistroma septosporum (strain NZE10 / CBS 128990) TaxID=675120 RepID=N1PTH3_DOTSN|nr:hypothetical protein DOTSEDRAFT_22715 [Dothistroma septosporum NZE10]
MAPFKILDLPPEIRNQIWEYVVVSLCLINISYAVPPLTQASRQLRNESRGIYFADNSFRLNLGLYNPGKRTNLYRLFCWLVAIGPDARVQINKVVIMFYWDVFCLDCAPGPLDIPKERFTFQMIAWHPLTQGLQYNAITFLMLDRDHKSSFRRRVARLREKLQLDYALGEAVCKGVVRRRFLALLAIELGPHALAQRPWLRWTCKRIIDSQDDIRVAKAHARSAAQALRGDPWGAVDAVCGALKKEFMARWVFLMVTTVLAVIMLGMWAICS